MSKITITLSVDYARILLEILPNLYSIVKDPEQITVLYILYRKIRRALAQPSSPKGETPA